MVAPTPTAPPPGWYVDPNGQWRWWDGTSWTATVHAPSARIDANRMFAILGHLGVFVGGFVVPLIFYLIVKDKDRFAKHHTSEALNFQITFTVFWLVSIFGGIAAISVVAPAGGDGWGLLLLLWIGVLVIGLIGHYVLAVVGAIKAGQGEWWSYPVNVRLVPGRVRDGDVAPELASRS